MDGRGRSRREQAIEFANQAALVHPCTSRHSYFLSIINEHFEFQFNDASVALGLNHWLLDKKGTNTHNVSPFFLQAFFTTLRKLLKLLSGDLLLSV